LAVFDGHFRVLFNPMACFMSYGQPQLPFGVTLSGREKKVLYGFGQVFFRLILQKNSKNPVWPERAQNLGSRFGVPVKGFLWVLLTIRLANFIGFSQGHLGLGKAETGRLNEQIMTLLKINLDFLTLTINFREPKLGARMIFFGGQTP
jgi:hypothetical protein